MADTATYPIQPFTPQGAQQIATITGQQPAPISANQLNAPQVQLPQPAYVPPPAPPPAPQIASSAAPDPYLGSQLEDPYQPGPYETQTADIAGKIGDLSEQYAGLPAYRSQQEQQYDIAGKKQTVTDLTNRFNTLKAAADQIPLQIQNDYQGRGATAAGVAPIQTAQLRENTIQQLGVSAMLQAANGNLSTAQDLIDSAVKAKFDPIEAELTAKQQQLQAIAPLLSAEEQRQAAKQQAKLEAQKTQLANQREDQKTIYDTMLTAAQYGADATTLRNIQNAASPTAAAAAASAVLGKKFQSEEDQRKFDNNIKLAQLAIDQAKLRNDTASVADPAQILAYAQQYASDGKIPTGLPKGTFGIVSQVAREMPKPDGTLVSNTTGIAPGGLSATQVDGIVALRDLQTKLDDAKTLFDSYNHGILAGAKNAIAPSTQSQQYNDLRGEIVDLLARARTGAAINASEEATYLKKLPGNFNKSLFFGASGDTKISDLKSSLSGKLNTTLQTHNLSIYGYSTVNLGGQNYVVGSIVTNDKGQQGRVNPDGSITIIQ